MNPVVAVVIGHFLGGESLGPRTIVGTLLVLVSVVVITTTPQKKAINDSAARQVVELSEP